MSTSAGGEALYYPRRKGSLCAWWGSMSEQHLLASVDEVGNVMLIPTFFGEDADGGEDVFGWPRCRLSAAFTSAHGAALGGAARRRPASRWQRACSGRRWWPLSAPRDVTYMETTASKSGIRVRISLCCAGDCAIWSDGIEGFLGTHEVGLLLTTIDGIGPQASARLVASFGDFSGFPTGAAVAAYVGALPELRHSGKSASACLLSTP